MEFNEKLQELRKQKGLTQEELAKELFVSRTAISKWESGRGYPNIESLKLIAKFFSVTVDELLSSNEALTLAEESQKETEKRYHNLVFGLLDFSMILLLFLPFFASRTRETVEGVSLLSLEGVRLYLQILYFILVIGTSIFGVVTLALQNCRWTLWLRINAKLSLALSILAVAVFVLSLQPYAAIFTFALLSIKALMLVKRY
jgi:transcriptional regulator with XRE-family HTH domain